MSPYDDFLSRSRRLIFKFMRKGYVRFVIIFAFKRFYERHKTLVDIFKKFVKDITSDLYKRRFTDKRHFTDHDLHVLVVVLYEYLALFVQFRVGCPKLQLLRVV